MRTLKMNIFPIDQFIFKILTAFIIFVTPIQGVLFAVSILIIVDAITGIWASKIKGEAFSSKKFFNSITKLLFYLLLILISQMVQLNLINEIPFTQLSIYFIVFYEFSSFLENVGVITGRDVFGFFKDALGRLKRKD